MIGQGVSSRSSHSWAAGRTTPSAKPWTQSRMSFWSRLRASEKTGSACSGGVAVSSAVADIVGTLPFRQERRAGGSGVDRSRRLGRLLARMAHAHEQSAGGQRAERGEAGADEEGAVVAAGQGARVDRARAGEVLRALRGERRED